MQLEVDSFCSSCGGQLLSTRQVQDPPYVHRFVCEACGMPGVTVEHEVPSPDAFVGVDPQRLTRN